MGFLRKLVVKCRMERSVC